MPGGLHIQRKAKYMFEHIVETKHPELVECQKVCSYAYAVSEQNADNGTIVTAPTCGSCGVLPAVLYYFRDKRKLSDMDIAHALGVAGLFGELAKRNASVSAYEKHMKIAAERYRALGGVRLPGGGRRGLLHGSGCCLPGIRV